MKSLPGDVIAEIEKAQENFPGDEVPARAFSVQDYHETLNTSRAEDGLGPLSYKCCYNNLLKISKTKSDWHRGKRAGEAKWYFWQDEK